MSGRPRARRVISRCCWSSTGALKISAHSSGAQQVPEALRPLELLFKSRLIQLEVLVALYQGRQALAGLDEDRFPTLWEAAKSGQGAPYFPGTTRGWSTWD